MEKEETGEGREEKMKKELTRNREEKCVWKGEVIRSEVCGGETYEGSEG